MRNKISGIIGVLWGGAIIVNWFLSKNAAANGAYQNGKTGAVIPGALLFVAGLHYFFRKPADK